MNPPSHYRDPSDTDRYTHWKFTQYSSFYVIGGPKMIDNVSRCFCTNGSVAKYYSLVNMSATNEIAINKIAYYRVATHFGEQKKDHWEATGSTYGRICKELVNGHYEVYDDIHERLIARVPIRSFGSTGLSCCVEVERVHLKNNTHRDPTESEEQGFLFGLQVGNSEEKGHARPAGTRGRGYYEVVCNFGNFKSDHWEAGESKCGLIYFEPVDDHYKVYHYKIYDSECCVRMIAQVPIKSFLNEESFSSCHVKVLKVHPSSGIREPMEAEKNGQLFGEDF
jgi:hypothetical protein